MEGHFVVIQGVLFIFYEDQISLRSYTILLLQFALRADYKY